VRSMLGVLPRDQGTSPSTSSFPAQRVFNIVASTPQVENFLDGFPFFFIYYKFAETTRLTEAFLLGLEICECVLLKTKSFLADRLVRAFPCLRSGHLYEAPQFRFPTRDFIIREPIVGVINNLAQRNIRG